MKNFTLKEKLQYYFDNLMSKGSAALVGILFLATLSVVILVGILLIFFGGDDSIVKNMWISLMHVIDAGTITGAETTNIPYIILMCVATICGLFVTSILIGIITTGFEEKLNTLKKGNSKVVERDHIVILGYNNSIFTILNELILANENKKSATVLILTEEDKETTETHIAENIEDFKTTKVICRTGSITEVSMLRKCSLETCKYIIINEEDDTITVKATLAVSNYLENHAVGKNKPYIVSTVNSKENLDAIKIIAKDNSEMILVEDSIARIIAQTCRQPGLTNVLIELFDFDGDEIYFEKFSELTGKAFGDALNQFDKAIVFGYKREGEIYLNPPMTDVLQEDDDLIILVEDDGVAKVKPYVEADTKALSNNGSNSEDQESILIIGINSMLPRIVSELNTFLAKGSKVIVASETIEKEHKDLVKKLSNIELVYSELDTSNRVNLENLLEEKLDHLLLLSNDDMDNENADARTLLKLIHLRDIAQINKKKFSITSELKLIENQRLAQITKANDLVVGSNIVNLILTQVAENRDLARLFAELLNENGAEIHIRPAEGYVKLDTPMTFYEVTSILRDRGEIAVGFKKQSGDTYAVNTNPLKSETIIFEKGDSIVTLSQD